MMYSPAAWNLAFLQKKLTWLLTNLRQIKFFFLERNSEHSQALRRRRTRLPRVLPAEP